MNKKKRKRVDDIDGDKAKKETGVIGSKKLKKVFHHIVMFVDWIVGDKILVSLNGAHRVIRLRMNKLFWMEDPVKGMSKKIFNWNKNVVKKLSLTGFKTSTTYENHINPWFKYFARTPLEMGQYINVTPNINNNPDTLYSVKIVEIPPVVINGVYYFVVKELVYYSLFDITNYELKWKNQITDIIVCSIKLFKRVIINKQFVITWDFHDTNTGIYLPKQYRLRHLMGQFYKTNNRSLVEQWISMNFVKLHPHISATTGNNINNAFRSQKIFGFKYVQILLDIQQETKLPIGCMWGINGANNLAFNFYKYRLMQKMNMVVPTLHPQKKEQLGLAKHQFRIEPKKIVLNSSHYDLDSAFPSIFLELHENNQLHSYKLHHLIYKRLLTLKRSCNNNKTKRECYKLMLNSGGYGSFNIAIYLNYSGYSKTYFHQIQREWLILTCTLKPLWSNMQVLLKNSSWLLELLIVWRYQVN